MAKLTSCIYPISCSEIRHHADAVLNLCRSTVSIHMLTIMTYYIKAIPLVLRSAMLGFPTIMLMNVMASRIYRNTKLGRFHSTTELSSLIFQRAMSTTEATSEVAMGVTTFKTPDIRVNLPNESNHPDNLHDGHSLSSLHKFEMTEGFHTYGSA